MGTMRNNFATVFVLLVLMLSTSQSLPHGYKNSPKRNSLEDDFAHDARSNSHPTYNCLFIDRNLPICDVERMLNYDETEDSSYESSSGEHLEKNVARRSRRNADVSAAERVVVYTIEGCIPSNIPFSLPSCDGISLDKIVDVQRFRLFVVKGVTQPPLVFPEFNYRRWLRMITRLQNHTSSNKQDEQQNEQNFPKEISVEDSPQDRKDKQTNVATTTQTMSNVMSASNEPSQSRNTKTLERSESRESSASSSIENAGNNSKTSSTNTDDPSSDGELLSSNSEDGPNVGSLKKIEEQGETTNNGGEDVWKRSNDRNQLAIPSIPLVPAAVEQSNGFVSTDRSLCKHTALDEPSNHLGSAGNSRSCLYVQSKIENDSDDLNSVEERNFRRRREARLNGNNLVQGIGETKGIAGKSTSQRFQGDTNQSNVINEQSHNSQMEQQRIEEASTVKEVATTAIPERVSNSFLKSFLASRKASWRRALLKEAALGKKHRTYMELPTLVSQ